MQLAGRRRATETFIHEQYHQLSLSEAELLRRTTGLSASMFPESLQEAEAAEHDSAVVQHTYLRVGRGIQDFTHRNRYSVREHSVGDGVA
jgi:hypothetical protein